MFSWPKLYPNMSCVPMYPLYCSVAFPYSTVLVCLCALSIQVLCLKLPSLLLCFLHFHAIMATVLSVDHISASMSLSVLSSTFTLNWFEGITPTFARVFMELECGPLDLKLFLLLLCFLLRRFLGRAYYVRLCCARLHFLHALHKSRRSLRECTRSHSK